MANLLTNVAPDLTREYIAYRPPVISRMSGVVAVYLYTDNAQPDAWVDSFTLGKRYRNFVPATTLMVMLGLRTDAGAVIGQNSVNADVRSALDRAVEYLGWSSSVNGTGGY